MEVSEDDIPLRGASSEGQGEEEDDEDEEDEVDEVEDEEEDGEVDVGDGEEEEEDDDDDDWAPELPPELAAKPARSIGPTLPSAVTAPASRPYDSDEEEDDGYGPMPLPAGAVAQERSGVQEFIEREERRQKELEVS